MIARPIEQPRAPQADEQRGLAEMLLATAPITLQQMRRLNFIKANRLSPIEANDIPTSFDPGPEFD